MATDKEANILLLKHLSKYLLQGNQLSLRTLSLSLFDGDGKGRSKISMAERNGVARVERVCVDLGIAVVTPKGRWKGKIS
jgi:hypothetical protein